MNAAKALLEMKEMVSRMENGVLKTEVSSLVAKTEKEIFQAYLTTAIAEMNKQIIDSEIVKEEREVIRIQSRTMNKQIWCETGGYTTQEIVDFVGLSLLGYGDELLLHKFDESDSLEEQMQEFVVQKEYIYRKALELLRPIQKNFEEIQVVFQNILQKLKEEFPTFSDDFKIDNYSLFSRVFGGVIYPRLDYQTTSIATVQVDLKKEREKETWEVLENACYDHFVEKFQKFRKKNSL